MFAKIEIRIFAVTLYSVEQFQWRLHQAVHLITGSYAVVFIHLSFIYSLQIVM